MPCYKRSEVMSRIRDRLVNATLRSAGWRVLRIWQHELRRKNARRLESKLRRFIKSPV
jgi:DNA mismatch endonuclease (patch repair protein)